MASKLAQYGLPSISARPAIHFLPFVWTSLHLSCHATANELWNKIFLMIIFSQEMNFHQRHKCIDSALSLINILSYRTSLACLKISGAAFQMEPCFWSIQMCHRLFARGDLKLAVCVAAAHLRALMGLLMVTCLFTLVPPAPIPSLWLPAARWLLLPTGWRSFWLMTSHLRGQMCLFSRGSVPL